MTKGWLGALREFVYFRLVAGPALSHPIAWAGLIALAFHFGWASAAVFMICLFTAYLIPNELLFREAARTKQELAAFLDRYRHARFVPIPATEFARHFDLSFLIPSVVRPERMVRYFVDRRLHVFMLKRGATGSVPSSPRAFVSPIGQDVVLFLRESLDRMTPETHFRLAHELGHAAAIYSAIAQRNVIGLTCVYASIAWILVTSNWSWLLIGFSLVQILLCILLAGIFKARRKDQHFFGEIAADYMAVRHLSPESVAELVETGLAYSIVQADEALDDRQTTIRRAILTDQLERRQRGEEIDIPELYMRYSFEEPVFLRVFALLHLIYVGYFAAINPPAIGVALAFLAPVMIHFMTSAFRDAELRVRIERQLEGGRGEWRAAPGDEPSPRETDAMPASGGRR